MGKISVLNFSGIYDNESFYLDEDGISFIDMKDLQGTNCMCDGAAKEVVLGRIGDVSDLHFIDSGNYHYVSALYLSMVKEPFSLVVLDHHPDMQRPMFDILSCGGWIVEVLDKNEYVRDVHIIGADRKLISELSEEDRKRVRFYDPEEIFGLGDDNGPNHIAVNLPKTQHPIYLSIDKDVIRRSELITNWDHGEVTAAQVMAFVKTLLNNKRSDILGIDICGECAPDQEECDINEAVRGNDEFNKQIIDMYKSYRYNE